jgi:Anti-sigma-K factor rskA
MREHGEIEELLALEALGGIEPEDRARLAALRAEHGECPECAELEAAFRETAVALATALPAAEVGAPFEDRVVAAALSEPRVATLASSRRRPRAWLAVAAAVVLVAIGALGGYLAAPRSSVGAFIQQPGVTLVPFEQANGGTGTMTLAIGPEGTDAYVIGTGLPPPPAGQVYEMWTITGENPTSLGCAVPTDGHVTLSVQGDFTTADVAAMTVESDSCPSAPTTDPVQVATLR